MAEQVVFEQTIEGLFVRALGERLTPPIRARLKAIGLDLDKRLMPAYPFDVWMQSLRVVAESLFPHEKLEDALFHVGEMLITGYQQTFMGRAILSSIRVLGPRRTLMRSTKNFRSGNNYTETKVTEITPTCIELWMNEVGPYPTFTAGILHAAMAATGARPTVEMSGHDGHGCTYRVSWV